jgi:alpha-galactosidase
MRPLHDGSVAVGLFNRGDAPAEASFKRSSLPPNLAGKRVKARDLWKHEAVTMGPDGFTATVPSHGVVLLKISRR